MTMNFVRRSEPRRANPRGVTLLELVAVVLILSLLATLATNVYTGQTLRARNAAAADTIRELGVAIVRYEIDTGALPPSGSGIVNPATGSITNGRFFGNGLLYLALVHSMSGDAFNPASNTWDGPYIEFNAQILEFSTDLGETQILDPFGLEYAYVAQRDYDIADPFAGTSLFSGPKPVGAKPELPSNNPFFATETFYNPTTFQIYSVGSDGLTLTAFRGAMLDDINNFGY